MTLEVMLGETEVQKPKRRATVKQRLSKTKLTYSMLTGDHEFPEANREFFLQRLWDDVLDILKDSKEAHALVDEAYVYQQNKEKRENEAKLRELLSQPGMKAIAKGLIPQESSVVSSKGTASTTKK